MSEVLRVKSAAYRAVSRAQSVGAMGADAFRSSVRQVAEAVQRSGLREQLSSLGGQLDQSTAKAVRSFAGAAVFYEDDAPEQDDEGQ
jgi:hypothetical protein